MVQAVICKDNLLEQVLTYDQSKELVAAKKGGLKSSSVILTKPQLSEAFCSLIVEEIIAYLIGTKWDYNRTTEIPRTGSIACEYFVTTVLRDAGVRLSRSKLAQLASEVDQASRTRKLY